MGEMNGDANRDSNDEDETVTPRIAQIDDTQMAIQALEEENRQFRDG